MVGKGDRVWIGEGRVAIGEELQQMRQAVSIGIEVADGISAGAGGDVVVPRPIEEGVPHLGGAVSELGSGRGRGARFQSYPVGIEAGGKHVGHGFTCREREILIGGPSVVAEEIDLHAEDGG